MGYLFRVFVVYASISLMIWIYFLKTCFYGCIFFFSYGKWDKFILLSINLMLEIMCNYMLVDLLPHEKGLETVMSMTMGCVCVAKRTNLLCGYQS